MVGQIRCVGLLYDQIHGLRDQRGYCRKASKAARETRLAPMDAAEENGMMPEGDAMDASETVTGTHAHAPVGGLMD